MDVFWIWLTLINGLGPITQKRLLDCFHTPENIFHAFNSRSECLPRLSQNILKQLEDKSYLEKASRIEEQMYKKDIKLLTIHHPHYPSLVKNVRDFPVLLYYRSKLPLRPSGIGIVGSRRCTSYGKEITMAVGDFLAKENIPVVSGMAKGIDGYAHTACIQAGGYTTAFLAHGVDMCYPSEQNSLMDRIIDHGAVISEYAPGVRPKQKYFPRRNYLLSVWIDKLLVVEATERSGALITASMAKKLGKEVLAVPNNIYQDESKGTNRLIKDGATIFLTNDQLLLKQNDDSILSKAEPEGALNRNKRVGDKRNRALSVIEKSIYDALTTPKPPEELLDLLEGDFVRLNDILFSMEMDGIVRVLPGNLIAKVQSGSVV
ncbi:DNA-processing protein DprA [Dehalobacter sp. DCM]|uniref:DNA-processing protein DprA n=1 Tax=Dehalobacter sp. DCM TaxID=2907827 RepID=UPI0030818BC4|nr:DNA-processing protein DprA [Dehalobacter sp. DCM]